ncbi:hypothetical protein IE53DRAFT_364220 [Violaceomyces palustris]|uniref:Uncharacterized protein n=1 Tax=Violaceomyces palustris TaxID=1673888 RepID=A0ACD0NQB9_9BASI|nr:hypothetical protein IE53DRAFT_364220 [Violaceomyces palustris]
MAMTATPTPAGHAANFSLTSSTSTSSLCWSSGTEARRLPPFVPADVKDMEGIRLRRADPTEDSGEIFGIDLPQFSVNQIGVTPRTTRVPMVAKKEPNNTAYRKKLDGMSAEELEKFRKDSITRASKTFDARKYLPMLEQGRMRKSAATLERFHRKKAEMTPEEHDRKKRMA